MVWNDPFPTKRELNLSILHYSQQSPKPFCIYFSFMTKIEIVICSDIVWYLWYICGHRLCSDKKRGTDVELHMLYGTKTPGWCVATVPVRGRRGRKLGYRSSTTAGEGALCSVCGAGAGRHSYYGGQVCQSCRAFFRRSGSRFFANFLPSFYFMMTTV